MSEQKVRSKHAELWHQRWEQTKKRFPEQVASLTEALRILHTESDPLRADKVGPVLVMGWWRDSAPSEADRGAIRHFADRAGFKKWLLRWRPRKNVKGSPPLILESEDKPPDTWTFTENGLIFEARKEQGDAFGLFLDHRENRQVLRETSSGFRVLNLFAFTCGFSLYAAAGGASRTVSVDLSKKYLQWGKANFQHNDIPLDGHDFVAMDSQKYLKWAQKKGLYFDRIICDPPSFSRNGKTIFKVDKDFPALISACVDRLTQGGELLFSTNFETWSPAFWEKQIYEAGWPNAQACPVQADFEGPGADTSVQKAFKIRLS